MEPYKVAVGLEVEVEVLEVAETMLDILAVFAILPP
jgi:hypothetical protein